MTEKCGHCLGTFESQFREEVRSAGGHMDRDGDTMFRKLLMDCTDSIMMETFTSHDIISIKG